MGGCHVDVYNYSTEVTKDWGFPSGPGWTGPLFNREWVQTGFEHLVAGQNS
ncbi:hypothetical protein Pyn_06869 [Prunus yedoensis var. nudiflora]|uniref:Uncharacterized protein n=1 Tax=Prunus yedoensis var. nudiflora TaxID=2094558 RepID=A0A314UVD0_PRUYE|nr:hypothetical protein Pyn_06869 [Prunus yedoensis var. nudiflora]